MHKQSKRAKKSGIGKLVAEYQEERAELLTRLWFIEERIAYLTKRKMGLSVKGQAALAKNRRNAEWENETYDAKWTWYMKINFILAESDLPLTSADICKRIIMLEPGGNVRDFAASVGSILSIGFKYQWYTRKNVSGTGSVRYAYALRRGKGGLSKSVKLT